MSDTASIIDRRASQLESLSTALFEIGRATKRPDAGDRHRDAIEKVGKKNFSPAATWMKPLVRGLSRFRRGSRNPELVRGVGRFSRSRMYHKRGVWAVKAKNGGQLPVHPKYPAIPGAARPREPKFYPAEDVPKPLHKNVIAHAPKLRANITPGTVLILLAGRYKGKRVVFLKQLDSGLLLVTGPFKINGVPLRRVNQSYVISTSTKIDMGHLEFEKFKDAYFKRKAVPKKRKGESAFFQAEEEKESEALSEERKADQIGVDAQLMPLIDRVPDLKGYLTSRFSLKSGMRPHLLVF